MADNKKELKFDLSNAWSQVQSALNEAGIEVDCCSDVSVSAGPEGGPRVKIVCVSPGLKSSVDEMSKTTRDQVVMVRVDEETSRALDAWVETGSVKSRSEAAALFIREGLKVRTKELDQLEEALAEVEAARERLRKRAGEVFGDQSS